MVLKCIYKDTIVSSISDMDEKTLKSLMSEKAYDLFEHTDAGLWLGDDGKVYEFEYLPYEDELIRCYASIDEFNEKFPELCKSDDTNDDLLFY